MNFIQKLLQKKGLVIFLGTILTIFIFFLVVNVVPHKKVIVENPWITGKTLISAHRGGSLLNPENTEKAFDYVIMETTYTDVVEIDVQITKDDVLVICHDSDINDFALDEGDADVDINDHTYAELREYNLGRNFVDERNNNARPYFDLTIEEAKAEGLAIMSLESFLTKYNNYRDIKLFLEIKESDETAEKVVDMVYQLLTSDKYSWWKERTIVITFDDDTIDYIAGKYDLMKGALGDKVITQVAFNKVKLSLFCNQNSECLQIPIRQTIGPVTITCATKSIIREAHKKNQVVTCYTINDEEDMKILIDLKIDVITTDAPDVLAKLLGRI